MASDDANVNKTQMNFAKTRLIVWIFFAVE